MTILLILICTSLCKGYTGNLSDSLYFRHADSLFDANAYRLAALEYDRAGFITENPVIKAHALVRKAESLKRLRDYEGALMALSRINLEELSDTLTYTISYESALLNYLLSNFNEAELTLSQFMQTVADTSLSRNVLPLYALILNEQVKWQEANLKLEAFIREMPVNQVKKDSLNQLRQTLYESKKYPKLKSVKKAQTLAYIPGLGQMYAGYPGEGILNIAFQAGSIAFGGYSFINQYYLTTFLVGLPLFQKFYFGGRRRVKYLVEKKNYEMVSSYNRKLKGYILDVQKIELDYQASNSH